MINPTMNEDVEGDLAEVENEYWKDLRGSLDRLEKNEDFQKLILEGYFKDKAVNSVSILADPGVKRNGQRPEVMEDLVAISNLQQFFMTIKILAPSEKELRALGEDGEE